MSRLIYAPWINLNMTEAEYWKMMYEEERERWPVTCPNCTARMDGNGTFIIDGIAYNE